jgi:5-hydroxyisourate hydrolase
MQSVSKMERTHSDAQQKLSLSTHILDTSRGQPAANVEVTLFKLVNGEWKKSENCAMKTNSDGRVREFTKINDETCGIYKLKFETVEYFKTLNTETLYPYIEITFDISDSSHYHIPLLLSAFGYSTYRGS